MSSMRLREVLRGRWLRWVASSVLTLLVLFLAAMLAGDREPLTLNERERSRLPGKFVALSQGVTNYEIMGPASGPAVLLVPGISIPRGVFVRTLAPLAEAGYRVVAFDLYGRGFSDRPRVRYDAALFNRQIDDLLAALRIEGPVNLVGGRRVHGCRRDWLRSWTCADGIDRRLRRREDIRGSDRCSEA
jgi:pimeloyl-ACP methyl ester carboxylesterase